MSGRRLALLVATYRYQDAGLRQLTAPAQDAEALAEVLRNPEIADFDVTILVNEPHHVVGDAIGEFYHNRRREDLTLLYFTGHGLKDDQGRLYLAMTDTKRDRLLFTGLSAQQIDEAMESCSSRRKIIVLDCCYSGAFPGAQISKADPEVHTLDKFQGRGRVVLTASDATQYSFEGSHIIGQKTGTQSVFTRFLVEGLVTGNADLDGDGDISLDELYSYVYDRVIEEMPQQRPKKQENVEGRIVIARNRHWRLPEHVRNAIESPFSRDRLAVLHILTHLHRIGNDLVRTIIINQIRRLVQDDSKAVSEAAMSLLTALAPEQARREPRRREPAVSSSPRHNNGAEDQKEKVVVLPSQSSPADDTTSPSGRWKLEARAASRKWWFVVAAGVAALALVAGSIVGVVQYLNSRFPNQAEQALLDLEVPLAFTKSCTREAAAEQDTSRVEASVNCTSGGYGANSVTFTKYTSASALAKEYQKVVATAGIGPHSGSCLNADRTEGPYSSQTNQTSGRSVCYQQNGSSFVIWTNDRTHTLAQATRADPDYMKLRDWWAGVVGLPASAEIQARQQVEEAQKRAEDLKKQADASRSGPAPGR